MTLKVTYRPTKSKTWHQAVITNLDGSITHLLKVGNTKEGNLIEVAPEHIDPIPTHEHQDQFSPGQLIQLNTNSEQITPASHVILSVIATQENTHLECMETTAPFETIQVLACIAVNTNKSMAISEYAKNLKSGHLAYFNFCDDVGLIISRVDHFNGKSMIELAIGERRIYAPLHMFRPA